MNITPIRAAVGAVVVLVAAMAIGYAANRGDSADTAPAGGSTTSSTVTAPASTATTPAPATTAPDPAVPTEPATGAPTPAGSATQPAPRPTPTTTEITEEMGPGAYDGDGE